MSTVADNPPRRVLIVDDEPMVLSALKLTLKFCGFDVTTAESGTEALTCMEQGQFDLVITDYSMIGMTGAQLAGHIKTRWPQQRIIMITAYAHCLAATEVQNVDAMLSKPFATDDLKAILTKLQLWT